MMTKWDTIQEDIKDAYVYLDEEEQEDEDDDTIFGVGLVSIEELKDDELDEEYN